MGLVFSYRNEYTVDNVVICESLEGDFAIGSAYFGTKLGKTLSLVRLPYSNDSNVFIMLVSEIGLSASGRTSVLEGSGVGERLRKLMAYLSASLHFADAPYEFLHRILRLHPRASCRAPTR